MSEAKEGNGRLYVAVVELTENVKEWRSDHEIEATRRKLDAEARRVEEERIAANLADMRRRLSLFTAAMLEIKEELARQRGARVEERVRELENREPVKPNGRLAELSKKVAVIEGWVAKGGLIDDIRMTITRARGWILGIGSIVTILSGYSAVKAFFSSP